MILENAYKLGLRSADLIEVDGAVSDLLTHEELAAYRHGVAARVRQLEQSDPWFPKFLREIADIDEWNAERGVTPLDPPQGDPPKMTCDPADLLAAIFTKRKALEQVG